MIGLLLLAQPQAFRAEASGNLGTADDYILINFLRSELGQDVGAHWSPLAAYHAGSAPAGPPRRARGGASSRWDSPRERW